MSSPSPGAATAAGTPLHIHESPAQLTITGADFSVVFDRVTGRLQSWRRGGRDLFLAGPQLHFWRAPTDNDGGLHGRGISPRWRAQGLHWLQHRLDSLTWKPIPANPGHAASPAGPTSAGAAGNVLVRCTTTIAPPVFARKISATYQYTISPAGTIALTIVGWPQGDWTCPWPRIGVQARLPADLERVTWYGLGPGEAYRDSRTAQRVGRWTSNIDGLMTNYVYPQENGNRHQTRWATFANAMGNGLRVTGAPLFDFSAHWYETLDLEHARHTIDLVKRPYITLNLDLAQTGLGSNSCGPEPLPQYQLQPQAFTFNLRFTV